MQLKQEGTRRLIDDLIAQAEMERMARLFLKRRNKGRTASRNAL